MTNMVFNGFLMEHLFVYLSDEATLIFKWQDFLGAVVGVMGSLFVGVGGFAYRNYHQKKKEMRENIRATEVSLALSLSDIYDIEQDLRNFLHRLNVAVITPLRTGVPAASYFLNETNFPTAIVHVDPVFLKAKYRSYYVHNKMLIGIRNSLRLNDEFAQMKIKYSEVIEKAKFLMQHGATPVNQQQEYLRNNESFVEYVNSAIEQLQMSKRFFAETKVYNLKLLEKKRIQVWRLEGISFKYFRNKQEIAKYRSTLECVDRIDTAIASEVDEALTEAQRRKSNEPTTAQAPTFLINRIAGVIAIAAVLCIYFVFIDSIVRLIVR